MAIFQMPATREEWLAMRRNYIGGSEVSALFGLQASFHETAFSLFHVKRGAVPEKELGSEIVEAGNFLEPAIASWACHREGWEQRPAVFAVDDHVRVEVKGAVKGMSGSLDRVIMPSKQDIVEGFNGPGVLECKNVNSAQVRRAWTDDKEPPYVQIQLQNNIACSGFTWGAVAFLDGGNRLVTLKYHARSGMHAAIRAKVTEFWQRVRDNFPYPVDGFEATTRALAALYPNPDDEEPLDFVDDKTVAEMCQFERALSERMKEDKEQIEEIRNKIRDKLGNHKKGLVIQGDGEDANLYRMTNVYNPGSPDRPAEPNEIIKGKSPSVWLKITASKPKTIKTSTRTKKEKVAA